MKHREQGNTQCCTGNEEIYELNVQLTDTPWRRRGSCKGIIMVIEYDYGCEHAPVDMLKFKV